MKDTDTCSFSIFIQSLDLHQKIVELESELRRSNEHISKIGRELMDNKQVADYEVLKLREELGKLRDRYDRSVSANASFSMFYLKFSFKEKNLYMTYNFHLIFYFG